MRRALATLLPAPLLSALLFITWLMLDGSRSAGPLVLGASLAVVVPWCTERRRPGRPRIGRWNVVLRLAAVVLLDIVRSNVGLARRILGPQAATRPRFVWVPLDLRDPHGIVVLASIVTMTPGTLSSDFSDDRRHLLVHAFDVDDEAALVVAIKTRYEAPLRAIFDRTTSSAPRTGGSPALSGRPGGGCD
jgi:multicomponent K+:H+ antiporter subunit E